MHDWRTMRGIAIVLASTLASTVVSTLVACSSSAGDDQAPTLEITSPERGTTADTHDITVTGRVTDDGPVTVNVNGVDAPVNADGTFSVNLTVDDGITLLETHALDKAGNDARDVRAVLAGDLSPTDGATAAPIGAHVGAGGFQKVGTALGAYAQSMDWNALAQGMNPVYSSSGCNSATIDITSLTVGAVRVNLTPKADAVTANVAIDNVDVKFHVKFKAVCIGGSTNAEVRSSTAHVDGDLALGVDNGALAASLPSSTVQLDGFSLDISGVPGAIESLVKGKVREAAEKAINNAIKSQIPPMASDALGGLLAQPVQTTILDRDTAFTITPADVSITDQGMIAAVDTKILVTGGEGGMYVSSPTSLSNMTWSDDLGVAVADDVLNQLLSGLWASGATTLDLSLDGPAGILAAVLDPDARQVSLDLLLPPVVRANNGNLELAIGDAILSVQDGTGAEVQRFALSLTTSLTAMPTASGNLSVTVGEPNVKAQVLMEQDPGITTSDKLEGIVNGAWGLVGGLVSDALGNLPLPSVAGISLGAPSIAGQDGFLVLDVPLQ